MNPLEQIKDNVIKNRYPFLDLDYLKNEYKNAKKTLSFEFDSYIIVGIGGSSQGSKAFAGVLNKKNIHYFDHLSSRKINRVIDSINIKKTGFIFISKSGTTSEVLTLFDHLSGLLKNKLSIEKNFLVITEENTAPLYTLAIHMGIHVIKHDNKIGGRFSIFSNTGLIPISFFYNNIDSIFLGLKSSIDNFINETPTKNEVSPFLMASKKFKLIQEGKNINIMLFYGDELFELGNWLKQLFAESLGKNGFGFLPIVSKMTQDQHSLLQLYLDGPKDKFFEIYSVTYNENNNFIDITLANHKDAMIQTLESENLPIVKNTNYSVESIDLIGYQLGYLFANSMLEVLILAEMGCVDAFSQDAVERQKNFLK